MGGPQGRVQKPPNFAPDGAGKADSIEFPLLAEGRRRVDILLDAAASRNAQGQIDAAVAGGRDVTKFRRVLTGRRDSQATCRGRSRS